MLLIRSRFPSGIWLGGLLLKPQLLIIIIPILIIQKNWKVLMGFFASSGVIIGSSLILSGTKGMRSLIDLWTQFGAGIAYKLPGKNDQLAHGGSKSEFIFGWIIAISGNGTYSPGDLFTWLEITLSFGYSSMGDDHAGNFFCNTRDHLAFSFSYGGCPDSLPDLLYLCPKC